MTGTNTPHISIIDDDKDLLHVIKNLLHLKGFEVATYFNWEKAYHAIKQWKPHLILMDVFLSENADGLDVCRKFKTSPFTKQIPVLIFSGFPAVGNSAIHEYGADDFIAKPFEFNALLKKLYSLLAGKRNQSSIAAEGTRLCF
jgi:DNA-binding response OmpR family regulator